MTPPHRDPGILHETTPCRDPWKDPAPWEGSWDPSHSPQRHCCRTQCRCDTVCYSQSRTRGSHSTDVPRSLGQTGLLDDSLTSKVITSNPKQFNPMTSSFKIRDFHSFATPRLYGVPLIICKDSKKTNKEIDLQASIWLLLTDRFLSPNSRIRLAFSHSIIFSLVIINTLFSASW